MAFTMESLETPIPSVAVGPRDHELPVREFVGYDKNGTTTITGSPINPKQENIPEDKAADITEESVTLPAKASALLRKEQAQRQREQALKKRESEFADRLADADKYAQLKAKAANKDFSAAEELGISYDEFVNYKLKQQVEQNPEEQRYLEVRSEIDGLKKAQEEQTLKEYQENQSLWKQEISKTIEKEEFSTIRDLNAQQMVLDLINDSFDEDGVELTAEQAAKEVEEFLFKKSEKFSSITKLKNKAPEGKVLGPPRASPKTITQNMTVTSKSTPASKPFHLMSESEQIAEAIRRVQAAKLQR